MTRLVATLLLACVLALLPTPARAQEEGRTDVAEPVQLRFAWWGGNEVHRSLLASVRAFEQRHPHIRVKTEYTGWLGYLERITTQIAGETAPDVMQINWNWLVLFSRHGDGFYDLERLGAQIDLDQFDEEAKSMGRVHGRLNALPTSMAARLFYFNATTYEKARVALPRSWDDLLAAGPLFRERLGDDWYPLDLTLQDVAAVTRARYVQQHGRDLIDEGCRCVTASADDLADMARFYRQLVERHVVPSARLRASFGYVAAQELRPWINGRFAGTYQWISAIGKFTDTLAPGQRVVLAGHPLLDGATDAGLMYRPAMMLAINARTAHPKESAMLVDFLLNDAVAVDLMGLKRGVPVSARAVRTLRDAGRLEGLSVQGIDAVRALPHAVRQSAYFEHARVRDALVDGFELLDYGRIDAEEFGARMHADLNRILARTIR
jgi:oligogalacturonide transport system substrate-binding protein